MRFPLNPIASQVEVTDSHLIVELADGRKLSVPLAWYPDFCMGQLQNGKIGNCLGMAPRSSGQIWMNILGLRGC